MKFICGVGGANVLHFSIMSASHSMSEDSSLVSGLATACFAVLKTDLINETTICACGGVNGTNRCTGGVA